MPNLYRTPYNATRSQRQSAPDDMLSDLTERIDIISSSKAVPIDDIEFKYTRLVGGYNWIDGKGDELIIAVPGLPDVWTGNQGRIGQLKPDIQIPGYKEYADHHGARLIPHQISRFEPLFHALDSPDDLRGIQLITDRNSLRKIYGLFTPDAVYGPKPFRIDAQKVGNVILFSRWESSGMRLPMAPHPFCWSRSHELATMEIQLEGMVSCHRMVRYEFGGVEIMVRFELDAVDEAAPKSTKIKLENMAELDSLSSAMRGTSVRNNILPLPKSTETKSGIKIHRTPYPSPPLSSFIEKKTRSARAELDYVDIYGQLVFSQTPHLYVARHNRGDFQTLDKIVLGQGKLKDIANATKGIMAKAAGMMWEMMEVTEEYGEVSFVWKGEGNAVEVWKGAPQAELSDEAREMLLAA